MLKVGEKNIINAVNGPKQKGELNKKTGDNTLEIVNNSRFQKLHEFILKKYTKERYRNQNLLRQDFEVFSKQFKLCIDVFDNEGKVEINRNIFDFIRENILIQKQGSLI